MSAVAIKRLHVIGERDRRADRHQTLEVSQCLPGLAHIGTVHLWGVDPDESQTQDVGTDADVQRVTVHGADDDGLVVTDVGGRACLCDRQATEEENGQRYERETNADPPSPHRPHPSRVMVLLSSGILRAPARSRTG